MVDCLTDDNGSGDGVDNVCMNMDGGYNVSFGRTGDASLDNLLDEVEKINVETHQLAELARMEKVSQSVTPVGAPGEIDDYAYNTGDGQFDRILNELHRNLSEYNALADQARKELGPGKYLSIEDAMNKGGRQGVSDFIQQELDWMDHATPEQLRQFEHQSAWRHEMEMLRVHEKELLHEQGELEQRFIKHQTKEQFEAEKDGYHQVNPWDMYRGYTGDPDIFEKNGELYRLIPGGAMVRFDC